LSKTKKKRGTKKTDKTRRIRTGVLLKNSKRCSTKGPHGNKESGMKKMTLDELKVEKSQGRQHKTHSRTSKVILPAIR